jgi:CRISPR/Cas system CMR-associated protein Cmr5 small subunit
MKRIQKLIPTAIEACSGILLDNGRKSAIDHEFNGYISSFGASIISAGLLPSIIFYSQKGDSGSDRHKLINCLELILQRHGHLTGGLLQQVQRLFSTNYTNNSAEITRLTENISDAAVALKLAIRTFPKSKKV